MTQKTLLNINEKILCFDKIYTQEVLNTILISKYISSSNIINITTLTISLIIQSTIIQKIFNITTKDIDKLKKLFSYDFKIKQNIYNINKQILFSKKIILLFKFTEWTFKNINTINLFYCICLFYFEENIKPILKILNKNINNLFININEKYIMSRFNLDIPKYFLNIIKPIEFKYEILVGREKEGIDCINIFERKYQRNPIIIGDYGIGKSKFIEKLAFNYNKKYFVYFDVIKFIQLYKKNTTLIYEILQYIQSISNIILVIKDIDILFDGSHPSEIISFIHVFINLLNTNKIQLVGLINSENKYNEVLNKFYKLKFVCFPIKLKELMEKEIYKILEWDINEFNNLYNNKIEYTEKDLKEIYNLSKSFIKKIPSPKKELLILDYVCSKVKLDIFNTKINTFKFKRSYIIEAISKYSNIPSSFINITSDSQNIISNLNKNLYKRIFGQDKSIQQIVSTIQRTFTGLKEKNKPIGSWLLCGPSGTGKTELVKSLASTLFGSESELIRFDMSEFKEPHDSVKLIGCPPGYVGYDKGGILTSAVKEKPYSIILFDEIEKAHPNVNDLMLQILDEGCLTDSYGDKFDFTNTIIIFTSNLGCPKYLQEFNSKSILYGKEMNNIEHKQYEYKITKAIKNYFKPELLNRLTEILIFNPLTKKSLIPIAYKYIFNIQHKLNYNNIPLYLDIDEEYLKILIDDIFNPLYGARPLKRKIEETIENPISEILSLGSFVNPYRLSILLIKNNKVKNSEIYYIYTSLKQNKTSFNNYINNKNKEKKYNILKKKQIQHYISTSLNNISRKKTILNNTYYKILYIWYNIIKSFKLKNKKLYFFTK